MTRRRRSAPSLLCAACAGLCALCLVLLLVGRIASDRWNWSQPLFWIPGAIPAAARRRGGDPAKRSFQALRIAVNEELDVLGQGLDQAIEALAPGGRLAVLAYHSGEDRIVKARLRRGETGGCICPPDLPCVCGAQPELRLLWRGAHTPTAEELDRNPRAASARLRAAERLEVAT